MPAKTDFAENITLEHLLRSGTRYLALFTAMPGENGVGPELSESWYSRQVVSFAVPVSGATSSNSDIQFPEATTATDDAVAFGIFDALTGGHLLYYGAMSPPQPISVGTVMRFGAGNVFISED